MRFNLMAAAVAVALGGFSAAAHADVNTVAGGVLFIDFTHLDQTSFGKDTAAAGAGLDVKRGYLTIGTGAEEPIILAQAHELGDADASS